MARKQFSYSLIILISCFYFFITGCSSRTSDPDALKSSQRYMIGAYYYLWYPENWRDGYVNGLLDPSQEPALGKYDSSDLKTLEQHIAWSSQYGIHFLAVSWWPNQPLLDRKLKKNFLRAKNINDIKFCIFYETAGLGLVDDRITFTPDKIQKMISDFKYLAQNYFSHPSYLKIKGRPVVIIYLTRTFNGDYPKAISEIRSTLKEMGYEPYLIGDEIFWYVIRSAPLPPSAHPNMSRIKLFDAITAYNMYDWAKPNQMGYGGTSTFLSDVHDLYQEYRTAVGKDIKLVPAIIPGYNDRGVRLSENHPVIPRRFRGGDEEGSFFSQALQRTVVPLMDSNIPMALITSFNEWNEGTQIEPTIESALTRKDQSPSKTEYTQGYAYQGYGRKYLSIIQDTFMAVGGRVVEDKEGSPLSRVNVKAFKDKNLMAAVLTDSQGFFNLSRFNLPPGLYEVKADIAGYHEFKIRIQVDEKKSAIVQIRLKKE
jgi:glycoprotein endo-alpha-1,2-mannosidase